MIRTISIKKKCVARSYKSVDGSKWPGINQKDKDD